MRSVSSDDFYYSTELTKSSNTLLVYANTLLSHFDKKCTLEDIIRVLSVSSPSIETDKISCQFTTFNPCKLNKSELCEDTNHYFLDCTLLEFLEICYQRKVGYNPKQMITRLPEMINVVLQYGVYEKDNFSSYTDLGINENIKSVKIIFKNVKSYNLDDINRFLSHLYFTD